MKHLGYPVSHPDEPNSLVYTLSLHDGEYAHQPVRCTQNRSCYHES